MAGDPRQEIELTLGGRVYRVRPTFRVLAAIEADLNASSLAVGARIARLQAPVREIAACLYHMTRGEKDAPKSIDEVGDILMDEGVDRHTVPLSEFLLRAWKGNAEHAKEAVAAETKADPSAAAP